MQHANWKIKLMNKKKTDKSERCRAFRVHRVVGLVSYPPVSTECKKHEVLLSKIPSLPITNQFLKIMISELTHL